MTAYVCSKCSEIFLLRESTSNDKVIIPKACPYCGARSDIKIRGPVTTWEEAVILIAKDERS